MTEKEIWGIATAGDGSLDPTLSEELGMPLEEFQAEKKRRQQQAAADRQQQEELNRLRSTGSLGGKAAEEDPIAPAKTYMERMEDAYRQAPAEQIDGQETLPGFEPQEEAAPAPLNAETIKKNIGRTSFKIDYMKDPIDAIAAYSSLLPDGFLSRYMRRHFMELVKIAAEETGADPAQIADKNRRTPEQDRLLTEIAGREQIARIHAFFNSLYVAALNTLDPLKGQYREPGIKDSYTAEELLTEFDPNLTTVKELATLYFFAINENLQLTKQGTLTDEQRQELIDIFYRLDAFYLDQNPDKESYYQTLEAFIENEYPKEEATQILEEIERLQSFKPQNYIIPNNALANALGQKRLIESPENPQGWDLPVANARGKRKEITSYTMVTYDPGDTGITITDAKLTRHERAVTNGIVSLWVEAENKGNRPVFSVDQIFRAMPGGSDRPSAAQKGAITKAIDKFTRLRIYVNASEEMQKRGVIKEGGKYIFDEYFLNVRRHLVKTENGGKYVQAYEILSQPVIYTYSKLAGNQIITIPAKYTAIQKVKENPITKQLEASGEYLAMTETRQAMTDYILQRIGIIKNDLKHAKEEYRSYNARRKRDKTLEEKPLAAFRFQSDTILFSSLFSDVGLEGQDKISAKRNRDFVFDVLDYQVVAGNIKSYEKQVKGTRITGVKIII